MQNSQINRVIKLVRKTGDKVVLMDNESDAVMMLMELGAYEKMLNSSPRIEELTEEELMEKINRDVAIWRANNDKEQQEKIDTVLHKTEPKPLNRAQNTPAMPSYSEQPTAPEAEPPHQQVNIPREDSASDIIAEEEEEKFYLEPVE